MSIYYKVRYAFEPQSFDKEHLAWEDTEKSTYEVIAQGSFDFFKNNRPVKDGVFANKLDLFLVSFDGNREMIVKHLAWHLYREDSAMTTFKDRVHTELDKVRAVAPVSDGVWIVLEKSEDTGEEGIVGVARTTEGVKKLMDIVTPVMDDTREVTVKYFSFIEGA